MNRELAEYFKNKKGLHRLLEGLKNKYISLGRYSGSVTIKNLSDEERIDLGNFLGRKINYNDELKVSFNEVTKKISETKFKSVSWSELFELYFGYKVISKNEQNMMKCESEQFFYTSLINEHLNSIYIEKVSEIFKSKNEILNLIKKRYNKNKVKLKEDLENIFLLLDKIPNVPTALPMYASLTGNPHYLDINTPSSNLFLRILSFIKNETYSMNSFDKIALFSEINVYTDPLSNYVITYNLIGNKILDVLSMQKEVVNLNLSNIINIKNVDTKSKNVYIFENPSMLNALKDLNVAIVITSGIPNLALYELLGKLENNKNNLYYNGDFDPEGLIIAEKMTAKFTNLKLFCYNESDYYYAKSRESINQVRMNKLKNISCRELQNIKEVLIQNKMAAYQEKNVEEIRKFIIKNEKFS